MGNREAGSHTAVFFFADKAPGYKAVARQMLFTEFEAMLDGLGTLPDYADSDVLAAYAVISKHGHIKALVFFTLYFDESGRADASWNVPVERLSEISGSGPDLGGGPIRLACRSQCSINWHQNDLWDPDMTPGSNDFLMLKKAVTDNRLRLPYEAEERVPVLESPDLGDLGSDVDIEKRTKLARVLKEQRLRIRTLESGRDMAVDSTDREQRLSLQALRNEVQELTQHLEQQKLTNEKLQAKLTARNQQYLDLQDKVENQSKLVAGLESKLKGAKGGEREQLERQKMEAELVLLKEQLDRKEIDLAYRDDREEQLRSELEEFKSCAGEGDGAIMQKLKEMDVVYTAYHAGAGHITMTSNEISDYAENPVSFVASKCFVTEDHYRRWLEHFENPVCRQCHAHVEQVSVPSEFEPGTNDYCAQHQTELML